MRHLRLLLCALILTLMACQSIQEKNQGLVQERAQNLRFLNRWQPTSCRLDTHLTQPAAARFGEMFPEEAKKAATETLSYTWNVRKSSCEIIPVEPSPLTNSHRAFLETALCILLQTHWVNSPFEELMIKPEDIVGEAHDKVQIRIAEADPKLGVFLDRDQFLIETKTKAHGTLHATYTLQAGEWLPARLQLTSSRSNLLVDAIEYDVTRMHGRRMVKGFWISVGDEKPFPHTRVDVGSCQKLL